MNNDHDKMPQPVSSLLLKLITGRLTGEEREELERWCAESESNKQLCQRLQDGGYLAREYRLRRAVNTERPMRDMRLRIKAAEKRRLRPWRYAAAGMAAVLAVAVALGGVYLWRRNEAASGQMATVTAVDSSQTIRHGGTKATLTLPDGRRLPLGDDTVGNHRSMAEGMAAVARSGGKAVALCLDVPRGGEFKVVLEDGTEVWLNSESRLTYPEHFNTGERRVSLRGEAYFKVNHEAGRPFRVETDGQLLRVYGTQFNIRSYGEDPAVSTTLVEGSVSLCRLDGKGGEVVLTPGHQSRFSKADEELSVRSVDTDVVTSWRHGKFVFEDQSLESIMRDLSRWYDFEYTFAEPGLKSIVFMGSIPRYADFNTALAIIEKSGGLKLRVSGRKVRVSRNNE